MLIIAFLGGDFNTTLLSSEKQGGSKVHNPFRENMEDCISNWDLLDILLKKGRYTWTNRRVEKNHIAAHLDRILVRSR